PGGRLRRPGGGAQPPARSAALKPLARPGASAAETLSASRRQEALRHALGHVIEGALSDPAVVEILANPDGRLVIDRLGGGRVDTGEYLAFDARERVIRLVADHVGAPITPADPRLSGVLPGGERFQGFLPPV